MSGRTFMGQPIRFMTGQYWPVKIDAHGFVRRIAKDLPVFLKNMENLNVDTEEKYAEQWMETFLAWAEIEGKDG